MSVLQETGSGLASIIGDRQEVLAEWEKSLLPSELPFAQWHAKFWGKRMTQPPMPAEGSGLGNERRGGDDSPMDVCMSEAEDSDDDVIKGCHSLEIDIERFPYRKIWIRAEYIRIYDAIETFFKQSLYPGGLVPAAVITGQPGIGKTVWIYYALRRRLAERKPVILYQDMRRCYLFVEEGVYAVPDKFDTSYFRDFVWTLVDSDKPYGIPDDLVVRNTRQLLIYCTSPCRVRWSRLHKTLQDETFIMNPWKRKEILRVAGVSHDRVNDVIYRLGPIPRLCIDYLRRDSHVLERYEADVNNAISALTTSQLERLSRESSSLSMDEVSHKIFLISRKDRENMHSLATVSPITPSIKSRLANHFRTLEHREQIRLFKYFSEVPQSRELAAVFFEAACQRCLRDGVTLEIVRMVRPTSSPRGTNPSRWYSSHLFIDTTLEPYRQLALQERQSFSIPRYLAVEEYPKSGPSSITSNVIYVPELPNQAGLNSFIVINGILYMFQFTVVEEHEIKPGLVDFFSNYTELPSMENWRFIFILPLNHQLVCPQPRSFEIQPYSAIIDLDKLDKLLFESHK